MNIAKSPSIIAVHSLHFALLLTVLVSLLPAPVIAQQAVTPVTVVDSGSAIENLEKLMLSIETNRETSRELRGQLKQLDNSPEAVNIEKKLERLNKEITGLQQTFEYVLLGGANQSLLTDQPEQPINWKAELEQISKPLLSSVKELTARPRQIDSLRREIDRRETQLKTIEKGLGSLTQFSNMKLSPALAEPVKQLITEWEQRRDDTQRLLDISNNTLITLKTESITWKSSTWEAITEFVRGRGLTLLLALVVGLAIWVASKVILSLYWRWLYQAKHNTGIARAPLFYYSYRLVTIIIIVLAILMVLYVRGDVLFLTLALIAIAGAALSLRQTLPRYTAELRLLLGVGPVREEERIVFNDVPYLVESLSIYSVLRNPLLEGVVRLPLHTMNSLVSRPAHQESWFPCKASDYVLFANGNLGRVLRQTIEFVEVAVQDTSIQIRTQDFLSQNVRNLTREGFGIANTFGIDYQHQAICLEAVPGIFREAILNRSVLAGLKDDIKDILVEFKSAGSSSLDYQIYVLFDGRAGKAYFRAQRMIQQACVDACNQEGWVIPFTQITVHSGNNGDTSVDV
jgi:small-conductance mechanosensitive channel